jgi:hypothetical protein
VTSSGREQILAVLPADLAAAARAWTAPPHQASRTRAAEETVPGGDLSPATQRAYRADWAAYGSWSGQMTPPASPDQVAVYLAGAFRAGYQTATVLRRASSISAVHARHGYPDPCARPPASEVITAIRALRGEQVRHARPLLAADLLTLLAGLPAPGWPAEPARRRDRLIVTLGSAADLGPSALVNLTLADVTVSPGEHALIMPGSSAAVIGETSGPAAGCAPCAYASWRELIDAVDTGSGAGTVRALLDRRGVTAYEHVTRLPGPVPAVRARLPLLRRIRRGGTVTASPLTAQVIGQVLRGLAVNTGLDPAAVSGLSLRASSQLEQLLAQASGTRPAAR